MSAQGRPDSRTLSEGILDAVCAQKMFEAAGLAYPVECFAKNTLLSTAKTLIDSGVWEQVKFAVGHEIEQFMRRLTGEQP